MIKNSYLFEFAKYDLNDILINLILKISKYKL